MYVMMARHCKPPSLRILCLHACPPLPTLFALCCALQAGLLAYDVFWVFGSPDVVGDNVMLTVATSDLITGELQCQFWKLSTVPALHPSLVLLCRGLACTALDHPNVV